MKTIITDPKSYLIQPQHINTDQHFWEAFGNYDKELSASWIVRLCKKLGTWGPFTMEQLNDFYAEQLGREEEFWFNGLVEDGFIVVQGKQYQITHEFVTRCFQSSPVASNIAQK